MDDETPSNMHERQSNTRGVNVHKVTHFRRYKLMTCCSAGGRRHVCEQVILMVSQRGQSLDRPLATALTGLRPQACLGHCALSLST